MVVDGYYSQKLKKDNDKYKEYNKIIKYYYWYGISCSEESINALKPGKYSSSTSIYGSKPSCTVYTISLATGFSDSLTKRF